jgi:phosphoribosylcarboxyaminoimidazole (NCAIR) mutase
MILGNGNHHVVSASKIPEDMEKYNKEFAGEDWRKLISITVKSSQIFKISGFYCCTVEIFALL